MTDPNDWVKLAYTAADLGENVTKADVRSVISVVLPYIETQIDRETREQVAEAIEAKAAATDGTADDLTGDGAVDDAAGLRLWAAGMRQAAEIARGEA